MWFGFFSFLFLNQRNSRQRSSPNHVKLGVSWDRLLFQHLSHPLLAGPTPLCSDWSESPKVCQCVHAFVCVLARETASLWVSACVWSCCVSRECVDLTHWWSVDCEAFKPCVLKSQMRFFHRSHKLGNYTESLSVQNRQSHPNQNT